MTKAWECLEELSHHSGTNKYFVHRLIEIFHFYTAVWQVFMRSRFLCRFFCCRIEINNFGSFSKVLWNWPKSSRKWSKAIFLWRLVRILPKIFQSIEKLNFVLKWLHENPSSAWSSRSDRFCRQTARKPADASSVSTKPGIDRFLSLVSGK